MANVALQQINYILCTLSYILSNIYALFGFWFFVLMWPNTQANSNLMDLQALLATAFLFNMIIGPLVHLKQRPCSTFYGGVLAAQICGLLAWGLKQDVLWALFVLGALWDAN